MKTRRILAVLAVASGLILAGCVLISRLNGVSTGTSHISLNGTGWLLETLNHQMVMPDTKVTLNFERNTLNGTDGCNRYNVSYTADGEKITVSENIAATRMACEEPIMEQASAYIAALTQATTYRVTDRQLMLLDAGGKILAAFTQKALKLAGKDQQNSTYVINGEAITLINGIAETKLTKGSASKQVTRYFGNAIDIDLNGDSRMDSAFLLLQDCGGSGTFYFVAAALNAPDGYVGTNAILIGDRIAPQNTMSDPDNPLQFIVNYADRKASETMSARPSQGISKRFRLEGDVLVEAGD